MSGPPFRLEPVEPSVKQPAVKRNPNAILDLMITQMQMRDEYKALYSQIHRLLQPGPERKFTFVIYDVRTASAELYALRETGARLDWKHRLPHLPLTMGSRRLQNNVKVVVHQLITKDSIEAGMRIRGALDSSEVVGRLQEGYGLEYADLERAFSGMETDGYRQFNL